MKRITSVTATILAAAFLTASTPTHVFAQGSTVNKRTILTFSGAVQVPGATLPAGTYVFRLADPDAQKVWQVLDAKERRILATFFRIPTADRTVEQMNAADGRPVVVFAETRQGVPPAIHVLYYPTDLAGSEFIYPKEQARQFAAVTSQPSLATVQPAATDARSNPTPADTAALTAEQRAPEVASEESQPIGTSGSELEKAVGTTGQD